MSVLEGLTILVLEDEVIINLEIVLALEQQGAAVRSTLTLEAALWVLEQEPVDLLISDLNLPDGNGWDLIRAWRETEIKQGRSPIPAILLTSQAADGIQEQALAAGFQRYIAKPFYANQLVIEVAILLEQKPPL